MSLINYQGDSKLLKRICQLLKVTDVQDGEGHSLVDSDGIAVVTGGGGGSSTLAGLSDVDTTGSSAGDVLSLDGTSGKWEGKTLANVATSGSYNDLSNTPTIPDAQVNSDWSASSGVAQILNKPTKLSDFSNDSGFITNTVNNLTNYYKKSETYTKTQTDTLLDGKVDKVSGKGLSTEDYTTTEKTKLSGIETGAQVNVQSDWNQTDNTADDYIKNKPTIPTGSGHTILNDSGTSLAQEDNLQFVGVYSNDDSANGKTKVNIIRKMTRAQLDLLSAEEKKGFIETTDETPSGISSFYRKPDDLQLSIVNGKLCITYDDGT